jgi:replication factor C subunit 3/5
LREDGKKALLKLSKGDMRRALNVLQACHAAYDTIGETDIYNCTGNPHPSDIETIVNSMLSDEFTTAYQSNVIYINFQIITEPMGNCQ